MNRLDKAKYEDSLTPAVYSLHTAKYAKVQYASRQYALISLVPSRGRDKGFEVEKILAQGYGFATICYQDIEPDFKGGNVNGIRPLFFKPGQSEPAPDDWGAIGAWSYGLSRWITWRRNRPLTRSGSP